VLLFFSTGLFSQDSNMPLTRLRLSYVDSLRIDSIRKEFILTHKPLTEEQLNLFKKQSRLSVYGSEVTPFINESFHLKVLPGFSSRSLTMKIKPSFELLFYSYVFLFIFLGIILSISPQYIKVIFELLLRRSSSQDKSRETKLNTSIPSLLMNLLFILSTSFFIYFAVQRVYGYSRFNQLTFILSIALLVTVLFLFKFFFLQLCGWIFKQKTVFDVYFTYLSLVNKALGLIFLFSSTLMTFGASSFSYVIFLISVIVLIVLLTIRIFNAFFIFSNPFKIGLPEFLIGFISMELLPTLVFFKFLQEHSDVLLNGFL
jgi:hypothetical protein